MRASLHPLDFEAATMSDDAETLRRLLRARRSVRAFTPDPVPQETVARILAAAALAPSGGNLQPWRIVALTGAPLARVIETTLGSLAADPSGDESEIAVYPQDLWEPYRSRRFAVGEAMYAALGLPREDKAGRLAWLGNNFRLFGAPVGLFVLLDRRFGPGQWGHVGMFLMALSLAAVAEGLGTCLQEAWQRRAKTVGKLIDAEPHEQLWCAVALGRPDPDHPVNGVATERAPPADFTRFEGFDA